jgi:hypothetical protein
VPQRKAALPAPLEDPVLAAPARADRWSTARAVLVAQQQLARQADGTGRVGARPARASTATSPSRKHTSAL